MDSRVLLASSSPSSAFSHAVPAPRQARPNQKRAVAVRSGLDDVSADISTTPQAQPGPVGRREAALTISAAVASAVLGSSLGLEALPANAAETLVESDYELFTNDKNGFTLLVPKEWERGTGTVGTRELTAFHPASTTLANVSVLITPLGADFTGLGSFGTVDDFGQNLVNGLDQSYLKKGKQKAKLIDATKKRGMYVVEYSFERYGDPPIRLISSVAVNFNGTYNRLITLTAQYQEEDAGTYEGPIRKIVNSFTVP